MRARSRSLSGAVSAPPVPGSMRRIVFMAALPDEGVDRIRQPKMQATVNALRGRIAGARYFFFLARVRLRPPGGGGTLPPARRASDSPMAIACLRLVTFLPERPLRSVPSLRSCMARLTLDPAFFPYRLAMTSPRELLT